MIDENFCSSPERPCPFGDQHIMNASARKKRCAAAALCSYRHTAISRRSGFAKASRATERIPALGSGEYLLLADVQLCCSTIAENTIAGENRRYSPAKQARLRRENVVTRRAFRGCSAMTRPDDERGSPSVSLDACRRCGMTAAEEPATEKRHRPTQPSVRN